MTRTKIAVLMITMALSACNKKEVNMPERYSIVPKPAQLVIARGSFIIDGKTGISVSPLNDETMLSAGFLAEMLRKSASVPLPVKEGSKVARNRIMVAIDTSVSDNEEGSLNSGDHK